MRTAQLHKQSIQLPLLFLPFFVIFSADNGVLSSLLCLFTAGRRDKGQKGLPQNN